ncbi:MAG: prepilin peptidase [Fibrobacter sp.]|nr:prepilin peptidase [Fibrobacter sp.]
MVIYILVALFGALLGSFFNVLIWRIPRNESVVFPASHCPECNRPIKPWENIPIVSYIFLGGKCAGCKVKISIVYPVVEIVTSAMLLLLWILFVDGRTITILNGIPLGVQFAFLILLIPIAVIDIRHYIIPDIFTLSFLVLSIGISFIPSGITPQQSLLGILAGGGSLWLLGFIGKVIFKKGDAMGGGDIKMMAAAGALWGPEIALIAIVLGAFLGSLAGLPMILLKKINADHHIPFGPFLGAGLWISVIAGVKILETYAQFIQGLVG